MSDGARKPVVYQACEKCGASMFVHLDSGRRFDTAPSHILRGVGDSAFSLEKLFIEHVCDDALATEQLIDVLRPMVVESLATEAEAREETGRVIRKASQSVPWKEKS